MSELSDEKDVDTIQRLQEKYDAYFDVDYEHYITSAISNSEIQDSDIEKQFNEFNKETIKVEGIYAGVYEDGSGEYILETNDQSAAVRGYTVGVYLNNPIEIAGEKIDFLVITTVGENYGINFSELVPGDAITITITGRLSKFKTPIKGGSYYIIDISE